MQLQVTFQPFGRSVYELKGSTILEAAARAGLTLDTPCGACGTCGKCRIQVTAGASSPTPEETLLFSDQELCQGWRLACRSTIDCDMVVRIPDSSLFASEHQILTHAHAEMSTDILPAIRKQYFELSAPTLTDPDADLLRLEQAIGKLKIDLSVLRELGPLVRKNNWKGTAVISDHHLLDIESGDTTDHCYGVAFDIGTTTLVASLLNLTNGDELAVASGVNPQTSLGDDVLSRIAFSSQSSTNRETLQATLANTCNELIQQLSKETGISGQYIYELTFAGNTTMEHLLCGLNVEQLGQVPFIPVHARGLMLPASQLGISVNPNASAYIFPVIGGFVGGDTVAGILATRLIEQNGPTLMIDIGTNGEIVLAKDGALWAASTAAGPAFEGARISCGMRASTGAIEKVVLDDDVQINVIGNTAPAGVCGSGLIDLIAQLLECGLITCEGRMLRPDELPVSVAPAIADRVRLDTNGQVEFLLAQGNADNEITLTQRDIRQVQLACGAIRAGITIMLKQVGVQIDALDQVLIAGGFGSYIRPEHARRLGLIPNQLPPHRIHYVGNVALHGAKWVQLSTRMRDQAEELARKARHVELSQDLDFQIQFAEAMIFPAPNLPV